MVAHGVVGASLRASRLHHRESIVHRAVLPCLYQTRTITRAYSSSVSSEGIEPAKDVPQPELDPQVSSTSIALPNVHDGLSTLIAEPRRDSSPAIPRRYSERKSLQSRGPSARGRPETSTRFPERHTSKAANSFTPASRSRPTPESDGGYIPFEGRAAAIAPPTHEQGSTMTNWEFGVFQTLFKKSSNAATAERVKAVWEQTGIADPLQSADGKLVLQRQRSEPREFPASLRGFAQQVEEERRAATPKPVVDTSEQDSAVSETEKKNLLAAKAAFDKTWEMIDAARTDVELWQVLEERVFTRLKTMRLGHAGQIEDTQPPQTSGESATELKQPNAAMQNTQPSSASENKDKKSSTPRKNSRKSTTPPPINWDLIVMSRFLSSLLTHCLTLLQTTFPGSPLSLSLVPTLKTLGPAAFALGVSTKLFNLHMQALYQQYADLDGIISTLEEMDREVYEFDHDTLALLGAIAVRAQAGRAGTLPAGENALWLTDHRVRAVKRLATWHRKVDLLLQEAALRRARESAEEGVEGSVKMSAVA